MTLSGLLALWLTTAPALTCARSYAPQEPRDHAPRGVVVDAATFPENPEGLLALPLRRVDHDGVATPSLAKRFFKTDVLGVAGAAYLAQLSIGTGNVRQNVSVLLDTGSFELWVNPDCDASNLPSLCEEFGHYDPNLSPTSVNLNRPYSISYGSGSTSGVYYVDDIYINNARIRNQQFGVSNRSDIVYFGIMGLAHSLGKYPTIIDSLAAQNYTKSRLFSMDLGGQAPPGITITGQMVFGGVDRNKYSGRLGKVSTSPSSPHYTITLTGLSHRAPGSSSSLPPQPFVDLPLPLRVIVDSGTTLSLLPERIVRALAAAFPGAEPDGEGGYAVPCDYQQRDGSVEFSFARGVNISVAYRDFVWNSGGGRCFLGAWYTPNVRVWILGDTFLRGAYIAFDQDNDALYMANYISCNSGPNLVPVPAGPDAAANIPGACRADVPGTTPVPSNTALLVSTVGPIEPDPTTTTITTDPTGFRPAISPVSAAPSSPSSSAGPTSPTGNTTAPPAASSLSAGSTTTSSSTDPGPTSVDGNSNNNSNNGRLPERTSARAQPSTTTTTYTYTYTYTSTVTEAVVATIEEVGVGGDGFPARRLATSFRTYVTTLCAATTTTAPESSGNPPVELAAPAGGGGGGEGEGAPEEEEEEAKVKKLQTAEVEVATERYCSTSTYAVTACYDGEGEGDCTVGMTTTRVVAVQAVRTVAETASAAAHTGAVPVSILVPPPPGTADLMPTTAAAAAAAAEAVGVEVVGVGMDMDMDMGVDGASVEDEEEEALTTTTVAVSSPAAGDGDGDGDGDGGGEKGVGVGSGYGWPMSNESNGVAGQPAESCVTCRGANFAQPTRGVAVAVVSGGCGGGAESRRMMMMMMESGKALMAGYGIVLGLIIGVVLGWL